MRFLPEDVIEGLALRSSGAADTARAHKPDGVGAEDAEFEDDDRDVEDAAEDIEFVLGDWWVLVGVWGVEWSRGGRGDVLSAMREKKAPRRSMKMNQRLKPTTRPRRFHIS